MYKEDCIFCKISKGMIPSYKIWENEKHIAFLDIFPAVEGMTVVTPKYHYTSYFADNDQEVLCGLIEAAKEVAQLLDQKLDNVLRTKLVFEGLDVDHLHVKLYPMYGGKPTPEAGEREATDEELKNVSDKILG
jgi:histidine triad (HIT) family protein